MFCPKCGTQNPDDGKFCRSCGVDISNVGAALSGELATTSAAGCEPVFSRSEARRRRRDPDGMYADGIRSIIAAFGFGAVSVALLLTGVAGGRAWWWAMLFPAFFAFARGVSDIVRSNRMSQSRATGFASPTGNMIGSSGSGASLPPSQTEYVTPSESRYKTVEGETMTLPKN